MSFLPLIPLLVLALYALLIWAVNGRVRTFTQGLIALGALISALGSVFAMLQLDPDAATEFVWSTLNGQPLMLRLAGNGSANVFVPLLLGCGMITAAGLMWTFGQAARVFGLVFAGLLVLILGGVLTAYSETALGALLGLGVAWLGGTIMQQSAAAHNDATTMSGLPLLACALALLGSGAAAQFAGGIIAPGWWIAGCVVLMGCVPRWATTASAPLLVRAPVIALGTPLLGGYLFLRYATLAAPGWPERTTTLVLIVGMFGLLTGAVNALTARRLSSVFAWQMVAQLALLVICFGTGQDAAAPIAAGLLAHTLVTGTAIALAIGQLERAARTDVFAVLPPLPVPLRRAGLAYGLAAISCAGIPPLLGYALRRVVLLLSQLTQPWAAPLLLAASTLLALSYLPTLVAFFRRPAFRSPVAQIDQRGGSWPLLLMISLLIGGLIPDQAWQYILGDPSVTSVQPPSQTILLSTAITGLLVLIVFGLVNRALRHPTNLPPFAGGEPLDEEPGWPLPFTALRQVLWFLIVPERVSTQQVEQRVRPQRVQLTELRQALERRYYLAVVVVGLISILLLATQR